MPDQITLGAEHDLGAAYDRLDAVTDDPDQVTAAQAELAEARAVHADACAAADAAHAAFLEAGTAQARRRNGRDQRESVGTW